MNLKDALLSYWYVIVIVILLMISVMFWQINTNTQQELSTLKSQLKLQESISQTEARLNDMKKREAELYPQLQKQYAEYEALIKKIEVEKGKLNEIKKEQLKKDWAKATLLDISAQFTNYGFPNTIVSK
jgi:uncharacterized protein HemX